MVVIKDVSKLNLEEITECLKTYKETGEPQIEGDILRRLASLWDEYTIKKNQRLDN